MTGLLLARKTNEAKRLSRLFAQKKIRRIYHGIYTDNLKDSTEEIVLRHWMEIVPHIVKNGILGFRTAADLKPSRLNGEAVVFVTSSYPKTIKLPGLVIKVLKGNTKDYIDQILPNLSKSNTTRMLLENLSITKGRYKQIKTIGHDGVEDFLAKELQLRNEEILNKYRDEAKIIAKDLGYQTEYSKLNNIISALILTNSDKNILHSRHSQAVSNKQPFDSGRIQLFEALSLYLKKCNFRNREYEYKKVTFKNIAFFESYFSNFIEGTEFILDEAEDIVFQGLEINNRHPDSHDVLANFNLSNDYSEMNVTPKSPSELLNILQTRHSYLMKERHDKRPGKFKEKQNKAGNTYFVSPNEVIGTLSQGFEYYRLLNDGIEKALFIHLMITETHPFDDGNGRLSRIMMNAELVKAGQYKIIIPTVHRDNYLNGLRMASRDNDFRLYCKVLDQAQAYTESINWINYGETREKIEEDRANVNSDDGLPVFNRALRKLLLSEFAA